MNTTDISKSGSYDSFIKAVLQLWASDGARGASARQISLTASVPVSSIYHHFGSLEQLFAAAQSVAIERGKAWAEQRLEDLQDLPLSPATFPAFFAQAVDSLCEDSREVAFAWREALAQKGETSEAIRQEWAELWHRFWSAACARLGVAHGQAVIERVFENECLMHLIRWRRLVDRACLDEAAMTLGAWLTGTPIPRCPWRDMARGEAEKALPRSVATDEARARIVSAAIAVLGKKGVQGLTHRAVAEASGATLGTVSHKFRSKSDLVEAAFEGIYLATVERLRDPGGSLTGGIDEDMLLELVSRSVRASSGERANDELFLTAARDPALANFGVQLRYLRGRTSRGVVEGFLGDMRATTTMEAALFSAFASSQIRAHAGAFTNSAAVTVREECAVLAGLMRGCTRLEAN